MPFAAASVPVFILDADPAQRRALAEQIGRSAGHRFTAVACGDLSEAESLAVSRGAIVLADIDGADGTAHLVRRMAGRRVIAMSARGSVTAAVEAMRAGAADFLPKPVGAKVLIERLEAVMAATRASASAAAAAAASLPDAPPAPAASGTDFAGFVGRSPAMRAVYDRIVRLGRSKAPVLVTGETGTGKEIAAEAIHAEGGKDRPFIVVNCAAIPTALAESEIFGHVRGAYTGAHDDRAGAAELAHGGTLFLDEVGELEPQLQAKLLRFLQSGRVQRVGEAVSRPVDIRLVFATNRDLAAEVAAGRFRADLFHRVNVLRLDLPPLRERGDDIGLLAAHFLDRHAAEDGVAVPQLQPDALAALALLGWSGNVREIQNAMRRLVVDAPGVPVDAAMVVAATDGQKSAGAAPASGEGIVAFHIEERRIIERAIALCGGSIARAAAALGIDASTIYRKRSTWKAGA
ncbi:MAG: sigma-54-dependent Fis family transcriptional regulator [Bauldia sp.]|nr:sigma-54-dependent Fis family transcriptional regulator [Bauldia sp.]